MNAVFADTFYWIALINPGDRFAQEVQRFDDLLSGGSVYTTEEVLVEVLTFFAADTWLRIRAVETVREILSEPAVHVIPQSHESFLSGFDLYAARPDKGYSLTDCISMQTMRREGLTQVLTNDRHFEQEGFRALFREPGER
ncbi:MAG TPA: PIN domain-containing protein [Bryobacteraceae bacterium]|nr:PIN domain-containing protein [Bryobacteraceae bacterium]